MDDRRLVCNRIYPFVLCPGRVVLGVTARGVCEVNLHVIRHFFKKIGGDQTLVSIELPLKMENRGYHAPMGKSQCGSSPVFKVNSRHNLKLVFFKCWPLRKTHLRNSILFAPKTQVVWIIYSHNKSHPHRYLQTLWSHHLHKTSVQPEEQREKNMLDFSHQFITVTELI